MVTLVHYGLGNIQAFFHIYRRLNIPVEIASSAGELSRATKIVLPGVGAFDWAITRLNDSGMRSTLDDLVINRRTPVLGVCVGMQMMATRSEEGELPGLGWIDAEVRRFRAEAGRGTYLPHMGWNDVTPVGNPPLLEGIPVPRFYFLHSYCVVPAHSSISIGTTEYGQRFTSAISAGHIFGVQFHPEKSHDAGIRLLRTFAEM
jgi:imidazole glycerol-phosphate synthase subunit HisH